MPFTPDTIDALRYAVDLVNTQAGRAGTEDTLSTTDELAGWLEEHPWSGVVRGDEAELRAVRRLRPRLEQLWEVEDESRVDIVNALLRDGRALPQLVRHDDLDWHIHTTDDEQPLVVRMALEAAMAFVDVIRSQESDRLKRCERDGCGAVYVDLSRNRSRRYCDNGCGNRVAVAAYRARQAETPA